MTFQILEEVLAQNNIPKESYLMVDSAWGYGIAGAKSIYYDKRNNTVVLTIDGRNQYYENSPSFVSLYSEEVTS